MRRKEEKEKKKKKDVASSCEIFIDIQGRMYSIPYTSIATVVPKATISSRSSRSS